MVRVLSRWWWLPCCCLLSFAVTAADDHSATAAQGLLQKYVGSYDTDALLGEPFVNAALTRLLDAEIMQHFLENLDVRGSVDVISGVLSISGNAVHHGGEEEAVLCVATYDNSVSAAILAAGLITLYSEKPEYQAQNLCIKDWITQANSGHRDRFELPANVTLFTKP